MNRGMRAVLLLLGLGAITVLMFFALGWWLVSHRPSVSDDRYDAVTKEGKAFGAQTDDRGCLTEAFHRNRAQPDFESTLSNEEFLRQCLRSARATENFCSIVPASALQKHLSQWREDRCAEANVNTTTCPMLLVNVITHCDRLSERSASAGG
jgi:hypothetical protein